MVFSERDTGAGVMNMRKTYSYMIISYGGNEAFIKNILIKYKCKAGEGVKQLFGQVSLDLLQFLEFISFLIASNRSKHFIQLSSLAKTPQRPQNRRANILPRSLNGNHMKFL